MVGLLTDEAEARLLVEATGRTEMALGPQRDLAVACLPGEAHALVDEVAAETQPPRPRLEEKEAQLGDRP